MAKRNKENFMSLRGTLFFHSLIFPAKGSNRFQTLQFVKHYTQQCSHGNFLKTLVYHQVICSSVDNASDWEIISSQA